MDNKNYYYKNYNQYSKECNNFAKTINAMQDEKINSNESEGDKNEQ